ncbi:MAG: hypothetical protein GXP55_25605 [Deltaproteobacteria bacterium]|nr:hypothetical protein [Deltaproteobacteria bacterium]
MVSFAAMNSRLGVLIGILVLVGLGVTVLYYRTSRLVGTPVDGPRPVSMRDPELALHTGADAHQAAQRLTPESLRVGAARAQYRELLESIRRAARARDAREPTADRDEQPTPPPDYAPGEMPRPGTRTSEAPIPSAEEQHRFFAALTERADPLVNDCYRALPEPRPEGTLMLVWSTIYDEDVGTVVERIELDDASEVTDVRVLECVRQSIFSVQLPDLVGYGRLQITSDHSFDGHGLVDDEDAPDGV